MAEAARPAAGMVGLQVLYSVLQIFIKLALNDGMDARVYVAYRFMFAAVLLCPIAFFVERYVAWLAPALMHACPQMRACFRYFFILK